MKFEWDVRKEKENIAKHGVSFPDAQDAFSDSGALALFDEVHSSASELRWWLLGKINGRVLLVRYTHRPGGTIRIIGAGYWKKGRDIYENYHKKHQF